MKKRIITFVICIALLLSLTVTGFADSIVSLGQVSVGQSGYAQVISDADGAVSLSLWDMNGDMVPDYYLPSGLYLEPSVDGASGTTRYFLKGSPSVAGDFSFVLQALYADGHTSLIQCNLVVAPVFSVNPGSQTCQLGDNITLNAQASSGDGSFISYQWYSSSVESYDYKTPVYGANSSTLSLPVSAAETCYYFCEASISSNGKNVSAYSSIARVSVLSLSSLTITKKPTKQTYTKDDELDTAGIEFRATYSDGSTRTVTDTTGMTFTPSKFKDCENGLQSIVVSWNGVTCMFPVQIEAKKETIEIVSYPNKTTYKVGDSIDTTGLKLRVFSGTGYKDVTTGFTISPSKLTRTGQQTITVIYEGGSSATFPVTVNAADSDVKLEIVSYPSKLEYRVGDTLETSGLILRVWNGDKYEDKSTGFTCNPTSFSTASNRQLITVKYNNKTVTFTVVVEEAAAEVTPSPVPTVDVTPSPEATVVVKPDKSSSEKSSAPTAIIILAVVIALASLAGAITYFYLLRKSRASASEMNEYEEEVFAPEDDSVYQTAAAAQRNAGFNQPQWNAAPNQTQWNNAPNQAQWNNAPNQAQRSAVSGQTQRYSAYGQPQRNAAPNQAQRSTAQNTVQRNTSVNSDSRSPAAGSSRRPSAPVQHTEKTVEPENKDYFQGLFDDK